MFIYLLKLISSGFALLFLYLDLALICAFYIVSMDTIFFDVFKLADLVNSLFFTMGMVFPKKPKIPQKLKNCGTSLYFLILKYYNYINDLEINISVQIVTRDIVVHNTSTFSNDYIRFVKNNGRFELDVPMFSQLPKDNKKLITLNKDFCLKVSDATEIYISNINDGIFKVKKSILESLANYPDIVNRYSFVQNNKEYLKIPVILLYNNFPEMLEQISGNDRFVNIEEFFEETLDSLVKAAVSSQSFNRNNPNVYLWVYDKYRYLFIRFCLSLQDLEQYKNMTLHELVELTRYEHNKIFICELPENLIVDMFKIDNSLLKKVALSIKKKNIKFTKSLFLKRLYNLADYKCRNIK